MTLPKTHIGPENRPSPQKCLVILLCHPFSGCILAVSFREGKFREFWALFPFASTDVVGREAMQLQIAKRSSTRATVAAS